jgi:lipopolysaccharide biosynthesis glycosyltransferase
MVNIVTYADCDYLQHATVLAASLNDVADDDKSYVLYLYHTCRDELIVSKVEKTIARFTSNITIVFKYIVVNRDKRLKSKKAHLNDSVYDKLYIYDHLPESITKIIFFDADIVLRKDPAHLYETDLQNQIIAAAPDNVLKFSPEARNAIGLENPEGYFNSGVMVIDLVKWRELRICERAIEFAIHKRHLTRLHDQDAFNHVIDGNWLKLSYMWNPRPKNKIQMPNGEVKSLYRCEVYHRDMSYLIHFSGGDKPWNYLCTNPGRKYYYRYLKRTGFKDFKPQDKTFLNFFRRTYLLFKSYLTMYKRIQFRS